LTLSAVVLIGSAPLLTYSKHAERRHTKREVGNVLNLLTAEVELEMAAVRVAAMKWQREMTVVRGSGEVAAVGRQQ
jgi:hypothetical protein